MATSKSRSNKRSSSGTCYSSTTTTIIFITLSGLFLWLLSSNSFSPPQQSAATTTKTSTAKISSIAHSDHHHHHQSDDEPASISEHLHLEPEQLPTDDHRFHADDDPIKSNENQDEEINVAASSDDHRHHSDHATTSDNDSDNNKDNDDVTDSKTETEPKIVGSSNDHHLQGKESVEEDEKQAALETQTSEESTVTQQQHLQQTKQQQNDDHNHDHKHGSNSETISQNHDDEVTDEDGQQTKKENHHDHDHDRKHGTNSETISQNHDEITDEDGQKRIEEHQKQEDEQFQINEQKWQSSNEPHGATSHDQIQHDEQDPTVVHDQDHHHETNDNDEHVMNHEILKHDSSNKKNGEKASSLSSKEPKKKWSTQADQSVSEKERRNAGSNNEDGTSMYGYEWQLCNTSAGADYIPCLDNEKVIAHLHSRKHHEHRERHCPEESPTCLVPIPHGYKRRIDWPQSRDKIWYHNVPHTLLAEVKGHQNWVKVVGEFLTFPGGGTQFIHGALHYIDFIQEAVPDIAWGKHSRVVLDVGCGVASFGGFLFEREVLTMSFAPKDEHEAQVQFALERGIPAISAVMGSQRLPFPSRVFDVVHCARCRVPWHADGGALLLELNRVLRPGGYFVWSATPVYQKLEEDVQIWREMSNLTVAMCWELITIKKDKLNSIGAAIYRKPETNDCYEQRKRSQPPMCKNDDDPNAAWYVPLQSCMHKASVGENERGSQWPEEWPERLQTPPYWLNKSEMGIFGKPSPVDFASDYQHWKKVVGKSYLNGLGISWSNVRNVMDMRAVYGGFAAALKEMKVWVMNVVNIDSPDTLPIIYERGLFGIYHDWCESFSTYPRTYDLLHADHLFSGLKKRCKLVTVVAEVDRIVRPGGKLIVSDDSKTIGQIENMLKSLHWKVFLNLSENEQHVILSAHKSETWRPDSYAPAS